MIHIHTKITQLVLVAKRKSQYWPHGQGLSACTSMGSSLAPVLVASVCLNKILPVSMLFPYVF